MSKEVEIFISFCHAIVSADLGGRRVVVKLVPRVLIAEQKKCLFAATDLLQCTESASGLLGHIITGKETGIYGYDPERPSHWFGNLLHHHSQRKLSKFEARQTCCSQSPPIKVVVCIMSSHQQVKQQVRTIIYNLCSVSVTKDATSNQQSDCQGMGKFTKTMHQHTHNSLCNTS
jgi:hypothetical protein